MATQSAASLRRPSQRPKGPVARLGDQEQQPDDLEQQQVDQKLQQEGHRIQQQGDQETPQQEEQLEEQQEEQQQGVQGLNLQPPGKHQDQQQPGELRGRLDLGLRLGGLLPRQGQVPLLLLLKLVHPTVLRPSGGEKLWPNASSSKMSTKTATTKSALRNAKRPRVEVKQTRSVGSTSGTRSATSHPQPAPWSAKRMPRLGFARPSASSLKATLTAVPPPVLPSVLTNEGEISRLIKNSHITPENCTLTRGECSAGGVPECGGVEGCCPERYDSVYGVGLYADEDGLLDSNN